MAASIQPVDDQRLLRTVDDTVTQNASPLLRLPIELLCGVVGHLRWIRDLKALRRTSKELCDIVTPRLYRKVDLIRKDGGDHHQRRCQDLKLLRRIASLLSGRSNLHFIRILNTGQFDRRSTLAIDALLPHLQKDALIEFNFSTRRGEYFPTGRQLQLLWRRQKKLRNFQLCTHHIPFMMDLLNAAKHPLISLTKSVTSLKLITSQSYFADEADELLLSLPVLVMSRLRCLTLNGQMSSVVVDGINELFANGSFVNLTELHVDQAEFYPTLDLSNLPSLDSLSFGNARVRYHKGGQRKGMILPKESSLRKIRWIGADPVDPTTLESVLNHISGLEYLEIESTESFNKTTRARVSLAKAIESHKETLKKLMVDEFIETTLSAYDIQFVRPILKCKKLKVLALPLQSNKPVGYYLNILNSLPDLVIFQIYDRTGAEMNGSELLSRELAEKLKAYPRLVLFRFCKCSHPDKRSGEHTLIDRRRFED